VFRVHTGPTEDGAKLPYIVADAHLLAPKLRTLSPHDTAAAARRNDGWNALERVRLLDLARRA
jgi:hypothetical protein